MTTTDRDLVSLDEAKLLVEHLEKGEREQANTLVDTIILRESSELFFEVGKLTRQLHDSLNNFQLDERIANLAQDEIPDARARLIYVIEETEKAANTTMDAVEKCMPIAEGLNQRFNSIMPEWRKLMSRQIDVGEFKNLCLTLDKLLSDAANDSDQLNGLLTEVLVAQGYQDLTGQVIRRAIELVKEVEDSLVSMLTAFGDVGELTLVEDNPQTSKKQTDIVKAEGPIIDADSRDDVVSGQDDVDDLLSSLGF
jgi:chemotaxis protein CheZ